MAGSSSTESLLRQVMEVHTPLWMSMAGVVAVGMGKDCIKVYFSDEQARSATSIPDKVQNWKVDKVVSDRFEKQ